VTLDRANWLRGFASFASGEGAGGYLATPAADDCCGDRSDDFSVDASTGQKTSSTIG
jgi:hypothetical protein